MRVVNLSEMKDIEEEAISDYGFSESLIIENVGIRGADFLEHEFLKDDSYGEVVFMIGHGNNGADALAISRNLCNRGFRTRAFLLFPDEEVSLEYQSQLKMAKSFGVRLTEIKDVESVSSYFSQTQSKYLIVDGILGTGFVSPLSNYLFDVVNLINEYASVTVAIDIPSGIEGDTGAMSSAAITADYTLAISNPKTGHYIGEGAQHSGELLTLNVGLPKCSDEKGDKFLLSPEMMNGSIVARDKFAHKNNFGHTLVVGGSQGLTGALILASTASLKVGAGLVSTATWSENYAELASRIIPEIMTGVIPTQKQDVEYIIKDLSRYDSIVIGPGLGVGPEARKVVLDVLNHFSGPVIVDADAIKVLSLSQDHEVLKSRKGATILTPHVGEFAGFIGSKVDEVLERPIQYLKELVDEINCCVVMKDACTFLGFPNGEVYLNYFPNDGMATGGTGDVLAGILGGLLVQSAGDIKKASMFEDKSSIYESLCLGVVVHSLAGKFASEESGVRSMTAGSIIESLSSAFEELEE